MDWAPRNDEASLQNLDEELKQNIRGRNGVAVKRLLLDRIRPDELLNLMPSVHVTAKEEIIQTNRNDGRRRATSMFLDKAPSYHRWGLEFLDALNYTGMGDIARRLCPNYTPPPEDSGDDNHMRGRGNDGSGSKRSGLAENVPKASPPPYSKEDPLRLRSENSTTNTVPQPPAFERYAVHQPGGESLETVPKTPCNSENLQSSNTDRSSQLSTSVRNNQSHATPSSNQYLNSVSLEAGLREQMQNASAGGNLDSEAITESNLCMSDTDSEQ